MKPTGLGVIALSLLASAWLFWALPATLDPLALTSQWIGTVALILMAWAQIMATRLPGIGAVFGPFDRVYVLHKWSGILAMAAMLIDDTVDADIRGTGGGGLLEDFGETLGELSLYGLLILAVISVATFIPYHLWKWTHKAMGAFFIAGALHAFMQGPFGRFTVPKTVRPQVWIAGSIGITPFMAWAEALTTQGPECHLIYGIRARSQAPHLARIEALATANPRLTLHLVDTSQGPRLTPDRVAALVGLELLAKATVAYCGPTALRETLRTGLRSYGVTARRFPFEAFEFRTGIGLEALALRVGKHEWAKVPKLTGRLG